jgi:hypothetical protein
MRDRCLRPANRNYRNYGARGIEIAERCNSFAAFLADMGPRPNPKHTLERRNNDGPYSPENCVWATRREQALNTRRTRWLTHNGRTQSMTCWAIEIGLTWSALRYRVNKGWPISRALSEPLNR